ncbi:interleukin-5 receptor subunit alpha-like isoform X2 [Pseudophryne corroboree]
MENYTYEIKVYFVSQDYISQTLDVRKCFFEYNIINNNEFVLHKGVCIDISTKKEGTNVKNDCTGIKLTPEGGKNTAAENISCVVYNVPIMNCSWSVGKEAPEDTQYSMDIRQTKVDLKCQNYRKDSIGRQVGCLLKCEGIIDLKHDVYIQVVGSSNQTSVRFTDKIIKPIDYVILDPPRNIQLSYNSNELEVNWEKPNTYSNHNCFLYNIYIKEKGGLDPIIEHGTVYKTSRFYSNEKVTLTMRVKWHKVCSKQTEWSRWSEPQIIGSDPTRSEFTQNHLLIVLGIGTAVVLILMVFLCHRFRIWTKLFPQVPKPAIKIFEKVDQKEIKVQKFPTHDIPFMKQDEEECVCSYITEISP